MGLVETRKLMAMRKQTTYAKASSFALLATEDKPVVRQRAKAGMKLPAKKGGALQSHLYKSGGRLFFVWTAGAALWYNARAFGD